MTLPFRNKQYMHGVTHIDYPRLSCTECMADSTLLTENFTNITVPKWGRICAQVKAKTGIQIVGDDGQASAKGITINWTYSETNLTLQLVLVHRSWFDPSINAIDTQMKAWVAAA